MLKLKFSILNMTRWPHIVKLKMMLEVRKPFFSRLGVYWLILLLLAGLYGSYKIWRKRSKTSSTN